MLRARDHLLNTLIPPVSTPPGERLSKHLSLNFSIYLQWHLRIQVLPSVAVCSLLLSFSSLLHNHWGEFLSPFCCCPLCNSWGDFFFSCFYPGLYFVVVCEITEAFSLFFVILVYIYYCCIPRFCITWVGIWKGASDPDRTCVLIIY